jgi:4-amino-4-deoxy-L-arabinose transferase-like glycosyltransferase
VLSRKPWLFFLLLIVVSILMHLHVFGRDLVGVHVWRQTQTQINIENFAFSDFNIFHPKSYSLHQPGFLALYEFPLMQWCFACFYKVFGDHVIISRLLTFLIGLLSLAGIHRLLKVLFTNPTAAIAGTWAFCFSPVFYYYIVNPLPDNFALCMSIWSLAYFFGFLRSKKKKGMLLSFLFLAIAVLCKLPFILYGIPWLVYFLMQLKKKTAFTLLYGACLLLFMLPAAVWYIKVIPTWVSNGVVTGIAGSKNASASELLEILAGNVFSTLPEMLINYGSCAFFCIALVQVFRRRLYRTQKGVYLACLGIGLILYFVFEMNMIGTVHDYYLFPFLPVLFILVAYGYDLLLASQKKLLRIFSLISLAILPLTAFLRINDRWNLDNPGFNKDLLTFKSELRKAVPDNAFCISGNDPSAHIWPYYLHKKCWSFSDDRLDESIFNYYCSQGAQYLISDSRQVESLPFVKARIAGLVMERNSIRIYELKH